MWILSAALVVLGFVYLFPRPVKLTQLNVAIQPFLNPENGGLYFAVFKFTYERPRTRNDGRPAGERKPDEFDGRIHAVLTEKFLLELGKADTLPEPETIRQIAETAVAGIVNEAQLPVFRIYLTAIEKPNRRIQQGGITIG